MTARPTFNLRLRAYTPLGDSARIIPDLGITIVSSPDGPTLSAKLSTAIYGSLPDDLEVAVEYWTDGAGRWQEGRDSRFVILGQDCDDRDPTGIVDVTGIGLPQWLATKAVMAGVVPYQDAGNVEAAASSKTVRISKSTFTWASHILGVGDRVRVTAAGGAKDLSSGAVYYVRNPSGATFQVSHTPNGAIKSFGSSSKVQMERVRTRIVNLAGHKFAKNMAVSVQGAKASNLTDGSQYYVVNPTATSIQVASKPGGIPIEFPDADALTVYRYLDGARQFKNQTPGQIIGTCFDEATDRGWGTDAGGTARVSRSWSDAGDSNSLGWPARVDDPSITGVSVGFQPGTTLWDQIRFMVDNGWAEFAFLGRRLDLFAPNTGTDYGATANQRRIGATAQQVQITKDLTDYRTAEIVRGEGPVENTVVGDRSPWGRLEAYATASGVSSAKAAKSYGRADLTTYSKPSIGYQVTEAAQDAAYLPMLDYQRGDWVMVHARTTWRRLRVTQWTLQKNTDGTVNVTVLLEAKKRSILHKLAKAAHKANGGRAATSTSTTPVESDKRKAAKPSNLVVTARTTHAADKSTKSTVTAKWLPVTSDEDGDDLAGVAYEVIARVEGEQVGKAVANVKGTQADLAGYSSGQTIALSVRAQSSSGEWGELTDEVEYIVDGVENGPQTPTAPVVVSTLGSVTASWDGLLIDPLDGPEAPPKGFAYVTVQRSADGGNTWQTETQTLAGTGTVTDLGLNVGATYSYRLIAVDSLGNQSAPSAIASCSVVGIDVQQINAGFRNSMDQVAAISQDAQRIANQTAATAGQALNAAGVAAANAQNAQFSADGKSKITYSQNAISGNGINRGDLWFQINAAGQIIGQWTWDGGTWQQNQITGAVITNIDAGSITAGTLSASRIAANSLSVNQLAVADFTNLFPSPHLDDVGGGPQFNVGGLITRYYGPDVPIGTAYRFTGRDNVSTAGFPVKSGDSFYIEYTSRGLQGGAQLSVTLAIGNSSGLSNGGAWQFYSLLGRGSTGQVQDLGNGWARWYQKVTIPAEWTDVNFGALYVQIAQDSTDYATAYLISDVLVRRAANARLIVDGSITALSIAAGAIDGKVITGATVQTASTAITSGGVILDSTGITGYNSSGSATFRVDNNGNATMTGVIHATGGTIDGTLTVGGYVQTAAGGKRAVLDGPAGAFFAIAANGDQSILKEGALLFTGSTSMSLTGTLLAANGAFEVNANAALRLTGRSGLGTDPQSGQSQLVLGNDGGSYISASAVYSRGATGRAVVVQSNGYLGTASSSRRTKNLHGHIKMDDVALDAWMGLSTWAFDYKIDEAHREQHGLVAEEVHDAGFSQLVYYDERTEEEGGTPGQIDGFAYEKMGVYNHLAMKRMFVRLQAAEAKLAQMEASRG